MLFSPAASSLASTPGGGFHTSGDSNNNNNSHTTRQQQTSAVAHNTGFDLEIHWDPSVVKSELLQASAILSHRGLKLASKWAAEQMVGIPVGRPASLQQEEQLVTSPDEEVDAQPVLSPTTQSPRIQTVLQEEFLNMTEQDWYAKSLVELGEYLHAAAVLSQDVGGGVGDGGDGGDTNNVTEITQMGPPLSNLSSYGIYLRAYALYMAGERRKEEEYAGLERYDHDLYITIFVAFFFPNKNVMFCSCCCRCCVQRWTMQKDSSS
jgi:hypothetical protein